METDILIVGSGTAGIYLGWQFAKRGRSVVIVEKMPKDRIGSKMDQFHFDIESFEKFDVPKPDRDSEEFIAEVQGTTNTSPENRYPKFMHYPIYAMRFQYFVKRLQQLAADSGVRFQFETEFQDVILEGGRVVGIKVVRSGQPKEIHGKLIVDSSGTAGIVRRTLPDNYGVDKFKVQEDEKMFVIQRHIRWTDDTPHPFKSELSRSWTYYKTWIASHFDPNGKVFGNGQPGGFQNTEEALQIFLKSNPLPPYEIIEQHRATTTYRPSPNSLVGDNFVCVGDSACMTKPHSGEGIPAAWAACQIIEDVVLPLLESGKSLTKEALWDINIRYFRDQGAKFMALLAQIPGAANTTKKENRYLFKKDVIFSSQDFEDMNTKYEIQLPFGRLVKIVFIFLWGLITGNYSLATLRSTLSSLKIAGRIRDHYEHYPPTPATFDSWAKKTDALWKSVGKMRYTLKEGE